MANRTDSKRRVPPLKAKWRQNDASARPGSHSLGIDSRGSMEMVHLVRAGFAFHRLVKFQQITALPWEQVARFLGIPPRTLTRRKAEGRLQPDESDRAWRASMIVDMAVALFEGDAAAAMQWLQKPHAGFGGESPLEFASTAVGAREVENLIGRLDYGVIA